MSRKARFVFLDRAAFTADELPVPACDHTWSEYPSTDAEDVVPRLFWATVAITHACALDAAALAQLHKLERIVITGPAQIAEDVAAARGIAVLRLLGTEDAGARLIALLDERE